MAQLPRASAYREQVLNDPEVATHLAGEAAKQKEDAPPPRPAWSEYTPEREALDRVIDRLGEVATAVFVAAGGRAPHVTLQLRPVTEVDRARARLEQAAHNDLVDEVVAAQERYRRNREGGG